MAKPFRLISNWQEVLTKAWSIRFMLAAGFFSGAEFALPYMRDFFPLDNGVFAALAFVSTAGGFISRLLAQRNPHEGANLDDHDGVGA
jgi:hypothetical protein